MKRSELNTPPKPSEWILAIALITLAFGTPFILYALGLIR